MIPERIQGKDRGSGNSFHKQDRGEEVSRSCEIDQQVFHRQQLPNERVLAAGVQAIASRLCGCHTPLGYLPFELLLAMN